LDSLPHNWQGHRIDTGKIVMGKLGLKDLQKLLRCIKADNRVVIPPTAGYDSGVHLLGDM